MQTAFTTREKALTNRLAEVEAGVAGAEAAAQAARRTADCEAAAAAEALSDTTGMRTQLQEAMLRLEARAEAAEAEVVHARARAGAEAEVHATQSGALAEKAAAAAAAYKLLEKSTADGARVEAQRAVAAEKVAAACVAAAEAAAVQLEIRLQQVGTCVGKGWGQGKQRFHLDLNRWMRLRSSCFVPPPFCASNGVHRLTLAIGLRLPR
jgi:hypothetical protein